MPDTVDRRPKNRSLILLILGALLLLIGTVLLAGGVWLAVIGGSTYYFLAGLGLVASGVLLMMGRAAGAWLYLVVFALTVIWALWEVGLNVWALIPRVFGPAVLAILVLLALPLLKPGRWRWGASFEAVAGVIALLVVGVLVAPGG